MEKIIRLQVVRELTGLSKSAIYLLIARGEFPRPLKLSLRASGWKMSEIVGCHETDPVISRK